FMDAAKEKDTRPFWLPDIQGFLALGIVVFVFLAFLVLIYGPRDIKGEILSVVTVVIGVLTGSLKDVYTYYFPGSKDMSGNSDALRKIALDPTPTQPASPVSTTTTVTDASTVTTTEPQKP
ncbi:MAG: hypothetical protein JWN58_1011, partial [Gammaproteobacteria bacterium]|nr:hypothetical protein [Gammaproteobacteria bacterium]